MQVGNTGGLIPLVQTLFTLFYIYFSTVFPSKSTWSWGHLFICPLSNVHISPLILVFEFVLSSQTDAPRHLVTHALVPKTFAQGPLGKLIVYRALSKRLQFICPGHTCLSVSVCLSSLDALETDMGDL